MNKPKRLFFFFSCSSSFISDALRISNREQLMLGNTKLVYLDGTVDPTVEI